jgi:hypothetical protein
LFSDNANPIVGDFEYNPPPPPPRHSLFNEAVNQNYGRDQRLQDLLKQKETFKRRLEEQRRASVARMALENQRAPQTVQVIPQAQPYFLGRNTNYSFALPPRCTQPEGMTNYYPIAFIMSISSYFKLQKSS